MYWPLHVVNLSGQEKVPQSPINERSRDGRSERGNKREREHTPHLASNHHIELRAFSTLCINHAQTLEVWQIKSKQWFQQLHHYFHTKVCKIVWYSEFDYKVLNRNKNFKNYIYLYSHDTNEQVLQNSNSMKAQTLPSMGMTHSTIFNLPQKTHCTTYFVSCVSNGTMHWSFFLWGTYTP